MKGLMWSWLMLHLVLNYEEEGREWTGELLQTPRDMWRRIRRRVVFNIVIESWDQREVLHRHRLIWNSPHARTIYKVAPLPRFPFWHHRDQWSHHGTIQAKRHQLEKSPWNINSHYSMQWLPALLWINAIMSCNFFLSFSRKLLVFFCQAQFLLCLFRTRPTNSCWTFYCHNNSCCHGSF